MVDVKTLRETRGLKQEEVAELLGISTPTYSKKENGSIKWALSEAKLLSDFFGMTIEQIFFGNEVSKNDT